mmetsp:Transcript_37968/g.75691  ORF Transcript_37968/g.75691 Transcript_37968/m.75691 type:complete len:212 (+) Transcript_37968:344-979(+)
MQWQVFGGQDLPGGQAGQWRIHATYRREHHVRRFQRCMPNHEPVVLVQLHHLWYNDATDSHDAHRFGHVVQLLDVRALAPHPATRRRPLCGRALDGDDGLGDLGVVVARHRSLAAPLDYLFLQHHRRLDSFRLLALVRALLRLVLLVDVGHGYLVCGDPLHVGMLLQEAQARGSSARERAADAGAPRKPSCRQRHIVAPGRSWCWARRPGW